MRIGNGGGGRRGLGFEQVGHFLEVDYFLTGRRIYVHEVAARGSVGDSLRPVDSECGVDRGADVFGVDGARAAPSELDHVGGFGVGGRIELTEVRS